MEPALAELKERLGTLADLRRAESVLVWDMTVWMPPGGGASRAAQLATIETVIHEHGVDERLGELFDALEPYAASLPPDSDDACLIRVAKRDWSKARRVPTELAAELALTATQSYEAWVKAREESDFASFRPWLERMVELRLRYVECFAPYDDPYDIVLDDFEPGMKTDEVRAVFAVLEPELVVGGHVHQAAIAELREFQAVESGRRGSLVLATAPGLGRPRPHRQREAHGVNVYESDAETLTVVTFAWDGRSFVEVGRRSFPRG